MGNERVPDEPTANLRQGPLRCYFLATRPAFLTVTLVAVVIGLASAFHDQGHLTPATALATLVFALIAHAAANVLNDFHDAPGDAINQERLFPFTGGSRFIQNGILSPAATRRLGHILLAAVVPAGLWLTWQSGPGLVIIGLVGLATGWAYSAPPLKLASRGLGELAVTGSWLLVVLGADYVQRGEFSFLPLAAGLGYALLVANLLYINQFPDRRADEQAGKRTLVVRLGPSRGRWGYAALAALAYLTLLVGVALELLPTATLLALLAIPLSWRALRSLWSNSGHPAALAPAIRQTIAAAHVQGGLLALSLILTKGSPL